MAFLFYFIIFLFGLCIGSFLNVLIYRLGGAEDEGISPWRKTIGGRSHCPECGHVLSWRDLVPVLSYILLRGRCRYCGGKISWQYPIVEITTGATFALVTSVRCSVFSENAVSQSFGLLLTGGIELVYLFFIASCLIVVFVSDLKYFIIPDEIVIAGVVGALIYYLFGILNFNHWNLFGVWNLGFGIWRLLLSALISAVAACVFFLAIVLLTRGKGMGLGDVKLAFLMGFVLGWPGIFFALLLAFISGALVGIILMLTGRAKMKSELPFGTFLSASTFLVMIFGDKILSVRLIF